MICSLLNTGRHKQNISAKPCLSLLSLFIFDPPYCEVKRSFQTARMRSSAEKCHTPQYFFHFRRILSSQSGSLYEKIASGYNSRYTKSDLSAFAPRSPNKKMSETRISLHSMADSSLRLRFIRLKSKKKQRIWQIWRISSLNRLLHVHETQLSPHPHQFSSPLNPSMASYMFFTPISRKPVRSSFPPILSPFFRGRIICS